MLQVYSGCTGAFSESGHREPAQGKIRSDFTGTIPICSHNNNKTLPTHGEQQSYPKTIPQKRLTLKLPTSVSPLGVNVCHVMRLFLNMLNPHESTFLSPQS